MMTDAVTRLTVTIAKIVVGSSTAEQMAPILYFCPITHRHQTWAYLPK